MGQAGGASLALLAARNLDVKTQSRVSATEGGRVAGGAARAYRFGSVGFSRLSDPKCTVVGVDGGKVDGRPGAGGDGAEGVIGGGCGSGESCDSREERGDEEGSSHSVV